MEYQTINTTLIDNTEDVDNVMAMNSLIEYRKNYAKATGSLWSYYKNELKLL